MVYGIEIKWNLTYVDVGVLDLYYIVATPNSFTTTNQRGVSRERSTEFFFFGYCFSCYHSKVKRIA